MLRELKGYLPFSMTLGRPATHSFHDSLKDIYGGTTVRLKVEENQLVGIFGEIGVLVDGLKGA
jgi:hypothetical protein